MSVVNTRAVDDFGGGRHTNIAMNCARRRLLSFVFLRPATSTASFSCSSLARKKELAKWDQDWIEPPSPKFDALSIVKEGDIERINVISPSLKKSFNLAAYVNQSETLQNLLKLDVDLSAIEKNVDLASYLMQCDFRTQIQPHIEFLVKKVRLPLDQVGVVINKNPFLFTIPIEDIQVRCNYFAFRKFSSKDIIAIFEKAPSVFSLSTALVDYRLGFLQKFYRFSSTELRSLIVYYPRIINLKELLIKDTNFMFKEELGFDEAEIKNILMKCPSLWRKHRNPSHHRGVVAIFDYLHGEMGFSHKQISQHPFILHHRLMFTKQRHEYLKSLNRAQYDPAKPLYVPLNAFYEMDDADFCLKYCKTSVTHFNNFLKTL